MTNRLAGGADSRNVDHRRSKCRNASLIIDIKRYEMTNEIVPITADFPEIFVGTGG